MSLAADNPIINNDDKDKETVDKIDVSLNHKDDKIDIPPKPKESHKALNNTDDEKKSNDNIGHAISRNNHKKNNTGSSSLSFANGVKKSMFTILSEQAVEHLYHNGNLPDNLDYDTLIKEGSRSGNYSKGKENSKIINNFLNRNQLHLNQKEKKEINQSRNNLNSSNNTNSNLIFKSQIRSPEQFQIDQAKYVEKTHRKVEETRKALEQRKDKENKSKPTINQNSKRIAERASSAQKKTEEIHIRLYEDMKQRRLSKEMLLQKTKNLEQNTVIHKKKMKKNQIDHCVNKLYQDGVDQLKSKDKKAIPCHMEKVSRFYSRDFSSYQSNIRTNIAKELSLNDSYENILTSSLSSCRDKVTTNNKMILLRKLDKDIDNSLGLLGSLVHKVDQTEQGCEEVDSHSNDKEFISYCQYCQLLFILGFIVYDHVKFKEYLKSYFHLDTDQTPFVDYSSSAIDSMKLEDIVASHSCLTNRITKDKMVNEKDLIIKSWNLIRNDKDQEVSLNKIKMFLFCVTGIYTGESGSNIEKTQKGKSASSSCLLKKKKINSTTLQFEDINKYFLKSKEVIKYDSQKAKSITQNYKKFALNRTTFEASSRNQKKIKKISNLSSNRELTFKPSLQETSRNPISRLKMEETYDIMKRRKNNDIERLQKEKELNEVKDCTFSPNNRPKGKKKSSEISNRLYSYSKTIKKNRNANTNNNNPNNEKDNELTKECTFSPRLNKHLNEKLFNQKSIRNDPIVSTKIKQYEKARIEKKLIDLLSEKGRIGLSQMKTSDDLLREFQKEENLKSFKFDLEKKQCKDTFDQFNNKEGRDGNTLKREQPMFTIEVKIKDRIELLDYYKDDDPALITQRFCKRNNLGESSNEKILAVIEEKLRSND